MLGLKTKTRSLGWKYRKFLGTDLQSRQKVTRSTPQISIFQDKQGVTNHEMVSQRKIQEPLQNVQGDQSTGQEAGPTSQQESSGILRALWEGAAVPALVNRIKKR